MATDGTRGVAEYVTSLYLGVTVIARVGWLLVAVGNISLFTLKSMLFAWELALLTLLTYEVHPTLFGGLVAGADNYFRTDRGLRWLVTGATMAMMVPWVALSRDVIHLPSSVKAPLKHSVPTHITEIGLLFATFFGCAVLIGAVLYLRPSPGFERVKEVLWTFAGAGADPHTRDQYDRMAAAMAGDTTRWRGLYHRITGALGAGAAIMLAATVLAILLVAILVIPKLLVLVVIAWLAYDFLARAIDFDAALPTVVWEVSEEIERPKKWFLAVEFDRFGLKGALAFFLAAMGILFAAAILSFLLPFVASIVPDLPGHVEAIYELLTRSQPGAVEDYWLRLALMGAVGVSATLVVAMPFLFGGYFMLVWYALLRRLPVWAPRFPHQPSRAEASYTLPWKADIGVPFVSLGYLLVARWYVGLPVSTDPAVVEEWVVFTTVFAAVTGVVAYLLWHGRRSLRTTDRPLATVARDNHRFPAYLSVFLLGFGLFGGTGPLPANPDILAVIPLAWTAYYIPDADRFIKDRVTGRRRVSLLQTGYISVAVVVTVLTTRYLNPVVVSDAIAVVMLGTIPLLVLDAFIEILPRDRGTE